MAAKHKMAPRPSNGEPCEVMHWLLPRKAATKCVPGVYLCWELMAGDWNCRWYWGTAHGRAEPTIPWCRLMWPDATPVSLAEAEAIHRYATGGVKHCSSRIFRRNLPRRQPDGPTTESAARSGVCTLAPHEKLVAGDPAWTDYVLETASCRGREGNAGLVFRVNRPGRAAMKCTATTSGSTPRCFTWVR